MTEREIITVFLIGVVSGGLAVIAMTSLRRKPYDEMVVPSSLYSVQVYWTDADQGFIARTLEYGPAVSAFGRTQAEAVAELQTAIGLVRDIDYELGRPSPDIITLETVDCARDKP